MENFSITQIGGPYWVLIMLKFDFNRFMHFNAIDCRSIFDKIDNFRPNRRKRSIFFRPKILISILFHSCVV